MHSIVIAFSTLVTVEHVQNTRVFTSRFTILSKEFRYTFYFNADEEVEMVMMIGMHEIPLHIHRILAACINTCIHSDTRL